MSKRERERERELLPICLWLARCVCIHLAVSNRWGRYSYVGKLDRGFFVVPTYEYIEGLIERLASLSCDILWEGVVFQDCLYMYHSCIFRLPWDQLLP